MWPLSAFALFAGTFLVELPASLVVGMLLPIAPPLAIQDVRGSIWHGKAMHVRWNNQTLGALSWTMRPGALALGKFETTLQLVGEVNATTRLTRGFNYTAFSNLDAQVPASLLQDQRNRALFRAQGRVLATIPLVRIENDRITAATGKLEWQSAELSGAQSIALGTMHARFALANDHCIHGTIIADEANFATHGEFVGDFTHYQVRATISPKTSRHSSLLSWIGQPASNGNRVLQANGGRPTAACRLSTAAS